MSSGLTAVAMAGLILLAAAERAAAQELVAGWEGHDGRGYAFVAPGFERALDAQQSIAVRVVGSYLYYSFPEFGALTDVRSPGLAVSTGYRVTGPRVVFTVAPGLELRRTVRETSDGRAVRREFGVTLQGDVFVRLAERVRGSWIGSYGHANRYVWSRAGLLYEFTPAGATSPLRFAIGGELTAQGNDDTRAAQAGAVVDLFVTPATASLQFRGGVAAVRDDSRSLYFGLGLYRRF